MSSKAKRLSSLVHERQPWNGHEEVYVCARWERLKAHELYAAAKFNGDFSAANRIVTKFVSEHVLDRIIDDATPFILAKRPLLVGVPHPPFDDTDGLGAGLEFTENLKNAIPFQLGSHIARLLDGDLDTEITQIARVGRTKLNPFERFLYQPVYQGDVRRDAAYILVDDVYSRGGTLAALRSHIVSKGGTVCSFAVLASSSGQWSPLALTRETCDRLVRILGPLWAFSGVRRLDMTYPALQKRKGSLSFSGAHIAQSVDMPLYNPSEIISLRLQAKACAERAMAVTIDSGVSIHPRVAAMKSAE
jgi:hypothetical protein